MWIATSPIVARAFAEVFYGARRRRNLEPATVAERGRLDLDELSDIEHGQVEPSLTLLMRSGLGLGVSPVWLLQAILDELALKRRMRAVGCAFSSILADLAEQELPSPIALGERLVSELAKRGWIIVSVDPAIGKEAP